MAYRPQYKNKNGNIVDLPIDAATVNGKTAIVEGDSRLTDARTPKSHTHTKSQITDFPTSLPANGGTADSISNLGVQTAIGNGTKLPLGLQLYEVYNNGYPTSYGNVLNVGGMGDGQLLIGWSGTTGANAPCYVRSRRDSDTVWSAWRQLAFTDEIPSLSGYATQTWVQQQGYLTDFPTVLTGGSQTTTSSADGGSNVYTFTKSDGSTSTFTVKNGSKGSTGATGATGAEGLGIFRSSASTGTGTTSITTSTITIPTGRTIKVGDLIIANSTYSYLYRVTAVNSSTVTVTYLTSLRGATGATGATGGSTFSRTQLKYIAGYTIDIDNASGWDPYAYKQLLIVTDQGAFWWLPDERGNTNVVRDGSYYYWFEYGYTTDDEGIDFGYLEYYRATGTGSASTWNTSIYIFGV